MSRTDISLCVLDELDRGGSSDRLVRNFVETPGTGRVSLHVHPGRTVLLDSANEHRSGDRGRG